MYQVDSVSPHPKKLTKLEWKFTYPWSKSDTLRTPWSQSDTSHTFWSHSDTSRTPWSPSDASRTPHLRVTLRTAWSQSDTTCPRSQSDTSLTPWSQSDTSRTPWSHIETKFTAWSLSGNSRTPLRWGLNFYLRHELSCITNTIEHRDFLHFKRSLFIPCTEGDIQKNVVSTILDHLTCAQRCTECKSLTHSWGFAYPLRGTPCIVYRSTYGLSCTLYMWEGYWDGEKCRAQGFDEFVRFQSPEYEKVAFWMLFVWT
jgi:hypothetical protein